MKAESGGSEEEPGKVGSVQQEARTCPVCGTKFFATADSGFCPVCILRGATGRESATTGEPGSASRSADSAKEADGESQVRRFEHYELVLDENGRPIELGRGAMGITYKAFDVDLRCPVTLKVISEKYLDEESARLRFLREARAAASVRHPNVASVLHLGRTGSSYFYTMEFVEGETLEHLIRRSGRVEVKLALEIATQVAAGLAAAHEQNLVHRDIKPSNIMVRLKDDGSVTAKIIDLGLAKAIDEAGAQTAISTPGAFAGTPEFASPEQFAGVPVDIRSDLYSLGITLWQMLTSRPPFRGTPAELIFQHQQAPLPLEQLKGAPQPVIVLLEVLLQKDPARRFQTPAELLELMPAVADVTEARRTIKHQRQWATLLNNLSSRQVKLPTPRVSKRSVAVLPFESLSDNKGDTYFADGVQDEILSSLAKASHLKVISRTSVMTFRPRGDRDLRSIAEALGVAYVVEGTVRRHGDRVRITIRLVGARTDKALWSESYDRDVTDVFVIQSEIAETVAHKLRARLSPAERQGIKEKPTNNLESYDLYLQAKQLIPHGNSMLVLWVAEQENLLKGVRLLEEATQRDPKFALAYCLIAKAHDFLYFDQLDHTQERRALGDAAVNEALRIRPDLPEVHLAAAFHLYRCYRDFERARVQIAIAARTLSSHSELLELAAMIDWRQGRWERSIAGLERAVSLDRRNPELLELLAEDYFSLRRYRDSERIRNRQIALQPDQPLFRIMEADTAFAEKADVKGARAVYEALPSAVKNDIWITMQRAFYAMCDRDWRTAEEIVNSSPKEEIGFSGAVVPRRVANIWLELVQGNHSTTEKFGTTREQLCRKVETDRTNPMLLSVLACVDVALGRKEEAIREARSAVQSRPASEDAPDGAYLVFNLAMVYARANEPDLAFEQLVILINTPNRLLTYGSLKVDPTWDPLRKDPRFDKLLAQLAITGVIDPRRRITRQTLQKTPASASHVGTRKPSARSEPKKISVARLPVTGSDIFGREEDISFLDRAWANKDVNVVTIVAWAGVGKSTLVNHWLRRMAAKHYRSAELVFGWSFYRQGSRVGTSSADEFLDAALAWFGDPDPRIGTAWEKGERLAKLIAHRRTLLVLDGLEPLQNPPGPQEGRLREPSIQALLRELAAFNTGLCVITTRTPVADIADYERTSALRRDLEQLSNEAGTKLLRALGVEGPEVELQRASDEFRGHCLALTLLGSYLTDAFNGDIRFRKEVSERLAHDVRQGAHARKVMESYQTWFGEGSELSVLRMLGLFDRPADEKALGALLKSPAIPGLTESLTNLSTTEWRAILARLRRARLLAQEDPHNPGYLDTHPLIREYFGEQLRSRQTDAWRECNRRLYHYYRTLAPQLPNSFREMEPLFLAVICGCNAGLFREALHEVYIPRIQRGNACFAANVLGATGPLLSALVHFFEDGRWGSLIETAIEGQRLTEEDQLFVLMQAGLYLTATRGMGAPEARICYERAEPLCRLLNRRRPLCVALVGQWRYSLFTDKLSVTMQIAERVHSLAQEQNNPDLMIEACRALAVTFYFRGDFEASRQYATRGTQIWRSGKVQSHTENAYPPVFSCLCHGALSEWHLGEIASWQATVAEAIALAKELNDLHALAVLLLWATIVGHFERNPAKVARLASDLIELSTRQNFAFWLAGGEILRGWARSVSGDTAENISWIEDGIEDWRATGSTLMVPLFLALKAEALHLADRTSDALEAIGEAQAMAERSEERWWSAEFHRLRGVFLTAIGAEETQIEASFCEALRVAREQKSVSLEKRAEATYAEYRRQKASASGGRGFRLPLC